MAKISFGIKGTPVKVEGETDPEKTESVVKHTVSSIVNASVKKSDNVKETIKTISGDVKEMFKKGTDDLKETSEPRHQHKMEKAKIKMEKDQQEHIQN